MYEFGQTQPLPGFVAEAAPTAEERMAERAAHEAHLDDLLGRSRAGDEAATTQFFAEIAPIAEASARRMLSNRTEIEDVVQDTCLRMHAALFLREGSYEPGTRVGGLVSVAAKNRTLDILRRQTGERVALLQ